MTSPNTIAIDGPAASGKSSIGLLLAKKLGYMFLDTGMMYRAVTLAVLERGIDIQDESEISKLLQEIKIDIHPSFDKNYSNIVFVNGKDVSQSLHQSVVNDNVSQISTYRDVRKALTHRQREIAKSGRIVMVGRDIGTVVLPKADLKIYLKASVEERAKRRYKEEMERGKNVKYDEILSSMSRRDEIDSLRKLAPLKPAKDAIIISTDGKSVNGVLQEILNILKRKDFNSESQ